jgi:hypothetical protein
LLLKIYDVYFFTFNILNEKECDTTNIEPTGISSLPKELMNEIFTYLPPNNELKSVNSQFYFTEKDKLTKKKRYMNWLRER